MNRDQIDLLQWLVPGLQDVPHSSLYWIEPGSEVARGVDPGP